MFLTLLTFISAISISVIAAGYSIIGLATLFAGAFIPIVAMGSALEVGKLVAASWLYHNWNSDVPRLIKDLSIWCNHSVNTNNIIRYLWFLIKGTPRSSQTHSR